MKQPPTGLDFRHLTTYHTEAGCGSGIAAAIPSYWFYSRVVQAVVSARIQLLCGGNGKDSVALNALTVLRSVEEVGGTVAVTGLDAVRAIDGPAVIIGNHMSTLETILLPALLYGERDVSFVVKQSLLNYPCFGKVLGSLQPIAVGRQDPRDDLRHVLEEGVVRLTEGRLMIVFPQSTRTVEFEPANFNSLGVKLARRAGVPVIPLALKTDFWGNGSWIKELGPIRPRLKIHFAFGDALDVSGTGKGVHHDVCTFIASHLAQWAPNNSVDARSV